MTKAQHTVNIGTRQCPPNFLLRFGDLGPPLQAPPGPTRCWPEGLRNDLTDFIYGTNQPSVTLTRQQKLDCFRYYIFTHICFLGHAEIVPRHISGFQFWHFEKSIVFETCQTCRCFCLTLFAGFRVSQQGASVPELPATLRRPQRKHTPGFWNMYFVMCLYF